MLVIGCFVYVNMKFGITENALFNLFIIFIFDFTAGVASGSNVTGGESKFYVKKRPMKSHQIKR